MQNLKVKFKKDLPILVFVWVLIVSGCLGQVSESPLQYHPDSTITPSKTQTITERQNQVLTSLIIQTRDTSLSFDWFRFYDANGRCVKTLRSEQLESRHPIYQLNFPTNVPKDKEHFDYYKPLEDVDHEDGKVTPMVNRTEKVKNLQSLKKYGITIKSPEKATNIIGNPQNVYNDWLAQVTQPACKFLSRIENATVIDALKAAEYDDFTANSLLDCAYITVYNYLGEIHKEIVIPDKLVRVALVSDDGRYLVCENYTVVANDSSGGYPVSSYLIVDLETKKVDYLSRSEFRQAESYDPIFSDGYFQITLNNPYIGDTCNRLFIDPYSRSFYIKTYPPDNTRRRSVVRGESFMLYEGIKEDISDFTRYRY